MPDEVREERGLKHLLSGGSFGRRERFGAKRYTTKTTRESDLQIFFAHENIEAFLGGAAAGESAGNWKIFLLGGWV